jgi:hypothetical protein
VGSGKNVILLELRGSTLEVRKMAPSYLVRSWRSEVRRSADLRVRWKRLASVFCEDLILWRRFTRHVSMGVHRCQIGIV